LDATDPEKVGPKEVEMEEGGKNVKMLQILSDCSGAFQPGVLTALVGSSGAGKTTSTSWLAARQVKYRHMCDCSSSLTGNSRSSDQRHH